MKKLTILVSISLMAGWAAEPHDVEPYDRSKAMRTYERPSGIPFPADNAPNAFRERLGRTLFFDPRLSGSGWISCATCHNPALTWADGLARGLGQGMKPLSRRTPTLLNLAWAELLFWDGRAESLEEQALGPIQAAAEMNMALDRLVEIVAGNRGYQTMFAAAYPGEAITAQTISKALANFERTIVSGQAPFDRWIEGDESAISTEAKQGFDLFNDKARCGACHPGWSFTDYGFHDIGMPDADLGRGNQLKLEAMQHAFKTPTLRNVVERAPYMHDGSEATLAEVVEFYDRGGRAQRDSLSPEVMKLNLTDAEKRALIEFMKTLSSVDPPAMVPAVPRGF